MDFQKDILSLTTPMDTLGALRIWLRTERQRVNWTQGELARRSGVPAASISRLERTGLASTDSLFKIVFALNRLETFQDFLKERQRMAAVPVSLSEPPRSQVRQRVRMKREST